MNSFFGWLDGKKSGTETAIQVRLPYMNAKAVRDAPTKNSVFVAIIVKHLWKNGQSG